MMTAINYTPPCSMAKHRPTDWRKSPDHPIVCGVCHPPVPGIPVIRLNHEAFAACGFDCGIAEWQQLGGRADDEAPAGERG